MKSTQESKILSAFEKYKGFSSNMFDNEDWRECDAFGAGVEFALKIAAEKAEIGMKKKSNYGTHRKWQKVKEEEVDLFAYEVQYFVDKDSILNCLK
jgi:hypothetical protein